MSRVSRAAGIECWDDCFRQRRESGNDLDWGGLWTDPFLGPLRAAGVRTILDSDAGPATTRPASPPDGRMWS